MRWRGAVRRLIPYSIAIAGGFLTAYLIAAFVLFPNGVIPRDVKVPNVIGLDYTTASQRIAQAGFTAEQGESRFHATAPKGTVLDQTPPAGSEDVVGAKVTLAVSSGQRMAEVPNVVNMTRADAEKILEQAGFDVGDVTEQPSAQPRGEIVDTRPRAGSQTVVPGPIGLVLSAGPSNVAMPDVVGRTLAEARQLIQQLGLTVAEVTADDGGAPNENGAVLSQTPAAGTAVAAAAHITLRVGSGG